MINLNIAQSQAKWCLQTNTNEANMHFEWGIYVQLIQESCFVLGD